MPVYFNGVWLDDAGEIHVPRAEHPAPTITTQPVGATIVPGATHDMTVVATSNSPTDPTLTYQWYRGVLGDGSDWVSIAGATASTYTYTGVLSDPAGLKFVVNVTDTRGQVTQSAVVTMVVEQPFHPSDLFAGGEAGDWYRMDSAGCNGIAVGASIGAISSKRGKSTQNFGVFGGTVSRHRLADAGGTQHLESASMSYGMSDPMYMATMDTELGVDEGKTVELIAHYLNVPSGDIYQTKDAPGFPDVYPGNVIGNNMALKAVSSSSAIYQEARLQSMANVFGTKEELLHTVFGGINAVPQPGRVTYRIREFNNATLGKDSYFYKNGEAAPFASKTDYSAYSQSAHRYLTIGHLSSDQDLQLVGIVAIERQLTDAEWADLHAWFMAQ